jgi:predicted Zn-dependent protease
MSYPKMMNVIAATALVVLAACETPIDFAAQDPNQLADANSFQGIAARIAPIAQHTCEAYEQAIDCRIQIFLASTKDATSNAFQSIDNRGRPFVLITPELLEEAKNPHEVALVLGHESAHAILGHLHLRDEKAEEAAKHLEKIVKDQGASSDTLLKAKLVGALFGARLARKHAELEADALGALLAREAGYNAVVGARFIDRIDDPGRNPLSTHPSNKQRRAAIARALRYGRLPAK